jgi:diadenosine tetraphosphate (Ap4A) HIT family hydrolase
VASGKSDPFFLLKDIDPGKPNRWLVLPRDHPSRGLQTLAALPPEERRALAAFAVAEAERLFPARWGIAVNGDDERTQCHLHVHLSPLRSGAACSNGGRIESDPRAVFDRIGPGGEVWVHPEGGRYHVHTAVPAENVLEP